MTQQRIFAIIARKETTTIAMKQDREEHFEERVGQQQKPDTGQFRLQVDRQTNGSTRRMTLPCRTERLSRAVTRSWRWRCTTVWQAQKPSSKWVFVELSG